MHSRPRIKICGVRSPEIACAAADAGAHAIGLVFAADSPRLVSFEEADVIAAAVPPFVEVVGLFVDHTVKQIQSLAAELPLTMIQLHGDYDAAVIDALAPHRVIRAVHFHADDAAEMLRYWDEMHRDLPNLAGILVDTPTSGAPGKTQTGGMGQTFDWAALRRVLDEVKPTVPIILAGGLTPANVAEAVRVVQPWAVDVSSGVESTRGIKDPRQVQAFCEAAITA